MQNEVLKMVLETVVDKRTLRQTSKSCVRKEAPKGTWWVPKTKRGGTCQEEWKRAGAFAGR